MRRTSRAAPRPGSSSRCSLRQEFVVCGFTDRANAAAEVGSLLLGYHDGKVLKYAGNVGTGWNARTGHALHARLRALEVAKPLFDAATIQPGRWSRRTAGGERWVKPELVAEVAFREWTPDGHIRHAVFQGLRIDTPASSVTREVARDAPARHRRPPARAARRRRRRASRSRNPDRVIDPSTGLTKLALVRYYESVAERILPHLADRPVSLVRAPQGITGELFFQKHPETKMPGLRVARPRALAEPLGAARRRQRRRPARRGADEHDRVPHLELDREGHRSSRSHGLRPRSRRGRGLAAGPGSGAPDARDADRAGARELAQDQRRQGPARGRAADAEARLRHGQGVFADRSCSTWRRTIPQRFVAKSGGTNRVGRIFVDYLRNGHGQTTAAAFSARSRPGLGVSMPVAWEQLMALKAGVAMDHRDGARIPQLRAVRPVGGLLEEEADARGGHENAGLTTAALLQRSG